MGGRIEVQSELGKGSRFEVHLPLPPGQAPREDMAPAVSRLPPLNILVADDVPQNLELLDLLLQADGHRVRSVRNGREALEQLAAQHFDLVLMDMHMPEIDGLSATRTLRLNEREHGLTPTPVIALTASVQAADRLSAQQAGMDGFAAKPVVRVQLFAEIARVLNLQVAPQAHAAVAPAEHEEVVDWRQGLTLWPSRERLQTAIASFVQAQAGAPHDLRSALARQDAPALSALAHRLGGAAGNLALPALRRAAQALEQAARAHDAPAMASGVPALLAQLDQLATLFPPSTPTVITQSGALPPANPSTVIADLNGLQHALQRHELDEEALQQLAEVLPAADVQQLIAAIDNFDFETAVRVVDELRSGLSDLTPLT